MSRKLQMMKMLVLVTALMLFCGIRQSYASHAMGADLTYECLGGNTYKIRVSFYRDCIGIPAPGSITVNVRSNSCNQNFGVTCNPIPGTGQEVTALCPTALTTCNGGIFTGIQEWVYEGVVTLPMQCVDWTFSWTHCCRNAAINTITSPGSSTFFIYGTLNNTVVQCNNSPTFTNKPVPFACIGQTFQFNHGAIDSDGDSLVYSLVDPQQTASTVVNYIAPYTANNPIASTPALQFNTANGDIVFNPTMIQATVMAVLVQEYRNGVLIGTVVRDIQVTVINCNNSLPTLTGINGTNDFDTTVCANTPVCFDIYSDDADAGQTLNIVWNNGIDSGSFVSNGANHPTGTFCWSPTQGDVSQTPYCFTVRVNDDACPYLGAQTYSYCVTVNGVTVDAGPDQAIACSDLATVTATPTMGTAPFTYLWSNGFTNPTQTVGIGTYIVTVTDANGCQGMDTVQIISAFEPIAAFTYNAGCLYSTVQFIDGSTTPGGVITSWLWNFGDGATSNSQNPTHTYANSGTYNVLLVVENSLGCIDSVIQPVTIAPLPVPQFNVGNICAGTQICFNNTSVVSGSGGNYNWNFGNGSTGNTQNPCITYDSAGTYTVTLIVQDSAGCADTLTQNVTVNPVPVANFVNTGSVCENAPIVFTDSSSGGVTGWSWNFGDGDTSTLQNPIHTYGSSGTYNGTLTVTNQYGCTATYTAPIVINMLPQPNAGPDVAICLGSSVTLNGSGGGTYNWNPGGATTGSITVSPSTDTTYIVTVTNANGCVNSDTVNVTVNPLPVATVSPDQSICSGGTVTLTATGGVTYNWSPSGATTGTITVSPGSSTTYAVDVINANGCQTTAFVNVTVNNPPVINLAPAVFTCTGVNATLNAGNGGTVYQWSNGATTQTITVNSQGVYTVTVTNQFGCSASAQTTVTVGGQVITNSNNVAICQGQTTTLNAGYPGSNYLWSNGSTTQTITVGNSGVYQVTVTDGSGCSGIIATTVNVSPAPVADFTPNDGCINSAVNFGDISSVNGSTITAWSWDFGDGNFSQQQNPVHTYTSAGTYNVSLTVTTASGCTATATDVVTIYSLPQANFSYNHGCEGTAIQFNDQSSVTAGNITGWLWDFGDGTTSTLQNPSHVFNTNGMQTVTLTITTAGGCTDSRSHNVQIFPLPQLAFNTSNTNLCLGTVMSITNNSTTSNGAINTWNWNFGDGTSSAQSDPSHTYVGAGSYNITLIATTSHGCSDTISQPVTVYANPTVNAGNNVFICRGNSTTLTSTPGTTYNWTPGGATTQQITVSPNNTTVYYVTVTNVAGCSATDSVTVNIKNLPNANAGPDQSICVTGNVTLNATGGVSYVWNPGNVSGNSITVNPAVTTPYIVTVMGANGCPKNDTVVVSVNALPVATAGPDQILCSGGTATLTATGGSTYYWSHNGSTTSTVYVSPSALTSYIVTVTDSNGCSNSDTMNVAVNPSPVVQLNNPGFFCAGSYTVLDAGNAGASYLWTPFGETSQSINVSVQGTYTVTVTNAFGCSTTSFSDVFEGGTGLVINSSNVQLCQGDSATLDAGNPGSVYLWSTGSTSQTITVNAGGTYNVTVTDSLGCNANFANLVALNPLPSPAFSSPDVCFGYPMSFLDTSSITSGSIGIWNWNFGNGLLSNASNASVIYNTPGTYNVTLAVTSGYGCTDSITKTITVHAPPVADFTANMVCHGAAMQFNDQSTVASGVLNNWNWNFNNGNTSSVQNPSYIYPSEGDYDVSLIVTSSYGCRDTVVKTVTVNPVPAADFTAPEVCFGDSMAFNNNSIILNGAISDFTWDFGDGTGSTLNDPSHFYTTAGTYNVVLIAGSDLGCNDTLSRQVLINDRPVADYTTSPSCGNDPVFFNDNSSVNNGSVTAWSYTFGDGTISNAQDPSHIYSYPGSYTTSLIAISAKGCRDTAQRIATVNPEPVAGFSAAAACTSSPIQFTDTSSVLSGSINSWTWSFGDGTVSNSPNPVHSFSQPGTYNVLLIVGCATGCVDSVMQSVNVFPVPQAAISSMNVCLNSATTFTSQSQVTGGGTFNYQWNFGDNTTDTSASPSHIYNTPGNYNVSLTVTTPFGCDATANVNVAVYDNPVADFTTSNVCEDAFATLSDASSIPSGNINSWSWTMGDGSSVQAQNVNHIYSNAGNYGITLTVMSNHGCIDTYTDSISIFSKPSPVILAGMGCVGDPVILSDTSSGNNNVISAWDWYFDNGLTSALQSPSVSFGTAGTHVVSLTTTNINGCRAMDTAVVIVHPLPNADFDAGNACQGDAIQFDNNTSINNGAISGYIWNFGDNSGTSSASNPIHTYANAGVYTVTLIAISEFGCQDTFVAQIRVNPAPTAGFVNNISAGCGPVPVQFTDTSTVAVGNIISWFWDFGDGTSSTLQNPLHYYSGSGNYSVTLTVTSDSGCSNTFTVPNLVTVYPDPVADFIPDPNNTQSILNPTFEFTNLSGGGNSYLWLFDDGGASSIDFEPSHTYPDTGHYLVSLIVTNTFGCMDTISKLVIVEPEFTVFVPNAFTPNNDGDNEGFNVKGWYIEHVVLDIFNRWGDLVFHSEGQNNPDWYGTVVNQSEQAPEGVYVYDAKITDVWGKKHQKTGLVSLVR